MDLPTDEWICRICLTESEQELQNIYAAGKNLDKKIEEIGGIKLNIGDNMPTSICSKCLLMLKVAYKFRTLCQRAQMQLLRLVAPEISHADDKNIALLSETKAETAANSAVSYDYEPVQEEIEEIVVELGEVGEDLIDDEDCEYNTEIGEAEFLDDNDAIASSEMVYMSDENFQLIKQENENSISMLDNDHGVASSTLDDVKVVKERESLEEKQTKKRMEKHKHRQRTRMRRKPMLDAKFKAKAIESSSSMHICCHCGNIYTKKAKLTLHMKIHTQEKRHECEICHKRFAETPQLKRHMNSHTGNRPFKCKYCAASFADPSTCIKHERIHTNERPYKCDICGKSFSYSNVLKVHTMLHTGEKPYSCIICGKAFSQLHHKQGHERTHSNNLIETAVERDDEF